MIHLDGVVYALQAYGGVSVYFKALAVGLHKQRGDVGLWLPSGDICGKPPSAEEIPSFNSANRPFERYRDYDCEAQLGHSSYYRLPASNVKSVVTVYDFTYERYFKLRQKLVHSWQKNRAIRKADAVICISESTRSDLFRFLPDVSKRKVHVVHLGVNGAFLQSNHSSEAFAGPDRQPYFLYVGARSTYKNFLPVVSALEGRMENLVCVGGGPFTEQETIQITKLAKGRVHHVSWVDDRALASLYRHALALVFPSMYEGFGIPVAEAMACTCPVIAAKVSSVPEVAGRAGYLLSSVTADSLRKAFDAVQDKTRRADMVALGLNQAASFSWQRCCDATREIYDHLMG